MTTIAEPESSTRNWYLIYTKPRSEQLAEENLRRQLYITYLPFVKVVRRHRGKYSDRVEPMFPRYLFIQLNHTTDNWSPIRSTMGVSSIVRFGDYPVQVPDALIKILQGNEDESGTQIIEKKEILPGDKVRILDGAMEGVEGIYESKTSKERVTVLLNIAGQYTRVSTTRHNIQLI